jgi:uncharacterized protein YaaN involved in tellurite resistance
MSDAGAPSTSKALELHIDAASAAKEVAVPEPTPDPAIEARAREYADKLLAVDPTDEDAKQAGRAAIDTMGRDLQRKSGERSRMLQEPIRKLAQGSEDGGPVAKALTDLRIQVEDLDPSGVDLNPNGIMRVIGMIPGIGTPLRRYFARFEKSQTVIDAIITSLENGRAQLERDNVTLSEDQKTMRALTLDLTKQVALGQEIDEALQARLQSEIAEADPRRQFVEEELLFPLRQRIMDLQQQLAVNQQGVLAIEIIVRNNRELVRGVDRAIDVTVGALQVAVTVALALTNQKLVLDQIKAVNETTSELISGTAERLRTQGTEIHEQAAGTMLDMEALRSAFTDITTALEEISRYRREALPQMAATIVELDQLAAEGEEAMQRLEKSTAAAPLLALEPGEPA